MAQWLGCITSQQILGDKNQARLQSADFDLNIFFLLVLTNPAGPTEQAFEQNYWRLFLMKVKDVDGST